MRSKTYWAVVSDTLSYWAPILHSCREDAEHAADAIDSPVHVEKVRLVPVKPKKRRKS